MKRFRDVKTEQFHETQLHLARQRRSEQPAEFLDRLRVLVRRTIPCDTDPALQRANEIVAERRLVTSFTSRLIGTAGRQVRLMRPTSG
jgi:hypothetical protein